ncbi:hypothetical protein BC332_23024 [Capsicum chinense]|nr:hypothetical protein BC332_23024 [Capsicum chinense]
MGGVGKTTLAKHIYNHLREESSYQVHWSTVSLGISIKGLQDDLAKIEKMDLSDVEDEHRRADQLNWAFKKMKNIVIILDDIWERLSLEKLGYPLGVEGCRLILTSRSSEAYQNMGCKELLEVKKLNTNDSWELFRKSLGSETWLSPIIEGVAKTIEGRCKGLPLGLITLEGSMRGVTDLREWKNSLKEFLDELENDVFKVLKYSYDRLRNTTMQKCFLYCDLYPEDYVIDRYELIDRFMMVSLVKGNSREEEFHHGHTILNKLVNLCLLEARTTCDIKQRLKSMPSVEKFKKLRLLDVFHTGIKKVLQGMENLIKLKVLHMVGIDLYELLKEILPVTTGAGDLAVMGFLYGNHTHFHLI